MWAGRAVSAASLPGPWRWSTPGHLQPLAGGRPSLRPAGALHRGEPGSPCSRGPLPLPHPSSPWGTCSWDPFRGDPSDHCRPAPHVAGCPHPCTTLPSCHSPPASLVHGGPPAPAWRVLRAGACPQRGLAGIHVKSHVRSATNAHLGLADSRWDVFGDRAGDGAGGPPAWEPRAQPSSGSAGPENTEPCAAD